MQPASGGVRVGLAGAQRHGRTTHPRLFPAVPAAPSSPSRPPPQPFLTQYLSSRPSSRTASASRPSTAAGQ